MIYVKNGDLQYSINNAAVGEVLVLSEDITLTSRVSVSNAVTIDLNGHVITGNINDSYGTIYVGTKGSLIIQDNSSAKTGGITNTLSHAIGNYGTVVIHSGTFIGNYTLYNFYYNNSTYGTATVNGGTFKSANADSPSIANCGDLTINGGVIESIDTTNILSLTDGAVTSLYVGVADYDPEVQNTSISGGHVAKLIVSDDSENAVLISGGTFDNAVDEKYLADGFELTYDEGTGTYGTISDSVDTNAGLQVIATSSSRVKDLVIKNNQLIFIQDLKRIAFDFKNKRLFYNQITELDTDADRLALEKPLNGYYFVIRTAVLWHYNNGWIQITEKPKEVLFIGVEFPELGQESALYVNKDVKEISVWDDETGSYIAVSNYTNEISEQDIENLFK